MASHTSFISRARQALPYLFGYNAVEDKSRRQSPKTRPMAEDAVLTEGKRRKLQATAADLPRNFELAAWAVRMHIAYVSRFDAHVNTGVKELDKEISDLFAWHAGRKVFDVARRHGRNEAMALFEICKVLGGDAAFLLTDRGSLQGIPGKRIARPSEVDKALGVNERGLVIDPSTGETTGYCICHYADNGTDLVFDQIAKPENVLFDGYYTDFDQTRGVSPLACAINRLNDTNETFEYAHLKMKLHALFGLAFYRDATTGPFPNVEDDEDTSGDPKYNVNFDNPAFVVDLDPGDKVEAIESKTPSTEFLNYSELAMRLALLALDIPYSFLDSRRANYSARIADANQYEFLCESKREKNANILREYSDWKLAQWLQSEQPSTEKLRALVKANKLSEREVLRSVRWIGASTPWVDKLKQLQGDERAIANGLDSRQRIARRRFNSSWFDIADELAAEEGYAKGKGATLMIGGSGQKSTEEIESTVEGATDE